MAVCSPDSACVSTQQDFWQKRKNFSLVSCRKKVYKIHSHVLPLFILEAWLASPWQLSRSRSLLRRVRYSLSWEQPWLWPELAPAAFLGAQSQCGEGEGSVWGWCWLSASIPSHRVIPAEMGHAAGQGGERGGLHYEATSKRWQIQERGTRCNSVGKKTDGHCQVWVIASGVFFCSGNLQPTLRKMGVGGG